MTSIKCVCKECSKEFLSSASRIKTGKGKYCSWECYKQKKCRRCKVNNAINGLRLCEFCNTTKTCTCCHQILNKQEFDGNNGRCKKCTLMLERAHISCRICLQRFDRQELNEKKQDVIYQTMKEIKILD